MAIQAGVALRRQIREPPQIGGSPPPQGVSVYLARRGAQAAEIAIITPLLLLAHGTSCTRRVSVRVLVIVVVYC